MKKVRHSQTSAGRSPPELSASEKSGYVGGTQPTIADLSVHEKQKVSRLVSRLVSLSQEHEQALASLALEKQACADKVSGINASVENHLNAIEEKMLEKNNTIRAQEARHAMLSGLLALYQAKLKNSSELFRFYQLSEAEGRVKQTQLESDAASLPALVSSQRSTIEALQQQGAAKGAALLEAQHQCFLLEREAEELCETTVAAAATEVAGKIM